MLRTRFLRAWRHGLFGVALTAVCIPLAGAASAQDLSVVETNFGGDLWVGRADPLELTLSRPPAAGDGRIAVFLGHVDVSDLVQLDGTRVIYDPKLRPLESGAYEVTVYFVGQDESWNEVARVPVQVLTRGGFEVAEIDPRLDIAMESQAAERHSRDFVEPERHRTLKGTMQAGWTSRHEGYGFELTTNANIVGASFQEEALRFGTEDKHARRVDLSDYLAELRFGPVSAAVGHFAYGTHRHLISNFGSRGVTVSVQPHERVLISGASMNGTQIVGYNNIVGLRDSENQIHSATLSLRVLANEFANGTVEGSWMSGSVLPFNNFNQGAIKDAEKSWGYGVRYFGDAFWGRARTDVSWARSRFDNPDDPFLAINNIEPKSDSVTQNARYGELAVDIVKDFHLGGERYVTITPFASHEQIDPLYKSLGVFTNSDTKTNQYGIIADVAGIFFQLQKTFIEDNLLDLDDILKTRTRDTLLAVQVPLPYVIGGYTEPLIWLPTLSYTWNRVHQFGANTPDPLTSGFIDPSQIPDQVDERWDASASWTFDWVSFVYRYSDSTQDNRQFGRERDDFKSRTHDVSVSITPVQTVFINLAAARTIQRNRALQLKRRTITTSASVDWEFIPDWTISATGFRTREGDSANAAKIVSTTLETQLAYQFTIPVTQGYAIPGRLFARWTRNSNRFTDNVFNVKTRTSQWIFLVGGSLSLF